MIYMSPGEVPTSRSTSVTWNGKLAMSASSPPTMKLPREAARATGRILSNHSMLEGLGRWPNDPHRAAFIHTLAPAVFSDVKTSTCDT